MLRNSLENEKSKSWILQKLRLSTTGVANFSLKKSWLKGNLPDDCCDIYLLAILRISKEVQ